MKKTCLAILAVLLAGVLFLAGCITSPTTESPSVPNTAIITTPAANTTSTVQSTTTQPKTGGTLRIGSAFWPQGNLGWPPDTLFRQAGCGCHLCISKPWSCLIYEATWRRSWLPNGKLLTI